MSLPSYYITEVLVVAHGALRLTFADGQSGEVDVLERMGGPVFERARTPVGFSEAFLDRETGTVTWPGGADLPPTRCMSACAPAPGLNRFPGPSRYSCHDGHPKNYQSPSSRHPKAWRKAKRPDPGSFLADRSNPDVSMVGYLPTLERQRLL